ncbi:aminopeptidase C [Microbacter margulisiae]|uniref:Aminopeptidase n=1 Tax=Microbacter margulisiae TaxID=1350067 RepID=A0A7W5H225_9PORP|nr:C1 family peptidase [Microbacter margulisiae]MBB3187295.1 aminopeptidase C [Microbacter margulisiae]
MKKMTLLIVLTLIVGTMMAHEKKKAPTEEGFVFTTVKANPITSVKNQANSGTCWDYSGLGFLESELLRMGKPAYDLSEMFIVDHEYQEKAIKYVRMHGKLNFGPGGEFWDVFDIIKKDGIVPASIMEGLDYGDTLNNHGELDATTLAYVNAIIANPNKHLSTAWFNGFKGILTAYLGAIPDTFIYKGVRYTPKSFAASLGLNMDDYVSITSFTHHPFYHPFALEIEDNWRWAKSYNVPLDSLMATIDYAINHGYTVGWAADVSERGFTRQGIGIVPDVNPNVCPAGTDEAKWIGMTPKERANLVYTITKPVPEKVITQAMRQKAFDNYETTDDHGMQIFGIAKDQNGNKYYMVKNSWGTQNKYKGIWYVSEAYVRYKTIDIAINKAAVPEPIRQKLGF